jgi:hypothetical protein
LHRRSRGCTKYQFILNLKTGKALGLEVPPMLLAHADEMIDPAGNSCISQQALPRCQGCREALKPASAKPPGAPPP